MAQLTQKTNQFNLTTRRYTEADITRFVESESTSVFALSVKDKFGDSGVTGLCIVRADGGRAATIDTLLLSCRILGRKIEYAFMNWLVDELKRMRFSQVEGRYVQTAKNAQVSDFFDRCSFRLRDSTETACDYVLDVDEYRSTPCHEMEILDGRKD
jgi:FkbH-like protein